MACPITEFYATLDAIRQDREDTQTQIYIIAGALGGACALLFLLLFIMMIVALKLSKRITEMEENERISEEINKRKFSAYTGEEVHRRLQTATPLPVVPGNHESEYAFNHPVTSEYKLKGPAPERY